MARYRVSRMQTNVAWQSPGMGFQAGSPSQNVDIRDWQLAGVAGSETQTLSLDLINGRLRIDESGKLRIFLSAEDCTALGAGRVDIEVLRIAPEPRRPLLRFAITNHDGLT
jgi:hypothetical protein